MPLLRSYAATPNANTERTFSDSFVKAIASFASTKPRMKWRVVKSTDAR